VTGVPDAPSAADRGGRHPTAAVASRTRAAVPLMQRPSRQPAAAAARAPPASSRRPARPAAPVRPCSSAT